MEAVKYSNLVWPGIDNIAVVIRACIFIFGLIVFGQGQETVGTILAISSYASRFWQPIMNLGNIFNNFINNIAYLERIFETMDEPITIDDAPDAKEMPPIRGKVTFESAMTAIMDIENAINEARNTRTTGQQRQRMKWVNIVRMYAGLVPLLKNLL